MGDDTVTILTTMSGQIGEIKGGIKAIHDTLDGQAKDIKDLRTDVNVLKKNGHGNSVPPAAPRSRGLLLWAIQTFGPWLVIGILGVGIYLGAGGDVERVEQVIQRVEKKMDRVEKKVELNNEP